MFVKVISGFIGGLAELLLYLNNLSVFSCISQHIFHVNSVILGIALHLIASLILFIIGCEIVEKSGIYATSLVSATILGIMFGSSVLVLFSLPVHLLFIPFKATLNYLFAHIFYGLVSCIAYYFMKRINFS